jgi:hypothetical protein
VFNYGGASPIPESPFSQLGGALGGIGQQAQSWIPAIMQMMQMKEQSARQNLQMLLGMPGLSEEQKRNAISQYEQSQSHAPSWMRLQWPQQQVPVPGTGSPAQPAQLGQQQGPIEREPVTPAQPAVPPQMKSQYYVPPQDPMSTPISAQSPEIQQAVRSALGEQGYTIAQNMTLGEVMQTNPLLGMQLFQRGGAAQGQTVGDLVPSLKGTTYGAQSVLTILDPKTGGIDAAKVNSMQRSAGVEPMTPYQTARTEQTAQSAAETRLNSLLSRDISNAERIASGGGSQAQVHAALQNARNAIAEFKKQHPEIDISAIEASVPDSTTIFSAGTKSRQSMDVQLQNLGFAQQRLADEAARLGIASEHLAITIANNANKISPKDQLLFQMYNAAPDGSPTRQRLQPIVDKILKGMGVDIPFTPTKPSPKPGADPTTGINAKIEGLWNAARGVFPKEVTDAMQRLVHGKATDADRKLLGQSIAGQSPLQIAQGIMNLEGQKSSYQKKPGAAPQAAPQKPVAALPAGLPDPKTNKGRTVKDTQTGKRYKSDGTTWAEVP